MNDIVTQHAIIRDIVLGFNDFDVLDVSLLLECSGELPITQNFDGWNLRGESLYLFIDNLLRTLDLKYWNQVKGSHVLVKCNRTKVYTIGNKNEDKWFDPEQTFEEYRRTKGKVVNHVADMDSNCGG